MRKNVALQLRFAWFSTVSILMGSLSAQHDRERNAFRYLAEDKVEKAYFELKNGKKHTDLAEKAFISTLCLLKEDKINAALIMAKKAVELGLPFERFLTEPRDWLTPLRKLSAFQKWKKIPARERGKNTSRNQV